MSKEVKILLSLGIVTTLSLVGVAFFLSKNSATPAASKPIAADLLIAKDSPKIASDSATVTIVEFADFQCPACKAAYPAVKKLLTDYQGKVNLVFRHFPLPQHKNAVKAALAAEAAYDQDKFWQMYDLLYQNQEQWAEAADPTPVFLSYAEQLNLDKTKFETSITDSRKKDKIEQDKTDGLKLGVNSTPTFFINTVQYVGGLDYQDIKAAVDQALSKNP